MVRGSAGKGGTVALCIDSEVGLIGFEAEAQVESSSAQSETGESVFDLVVVFLAHALQGDLISGRVHLCFALLDYDSFARRIYARSAESHSGVLKAAHSQLKVSELKLKANISYGDWNIGNDEAG